VTVADAGDIGALRVVRADVVGSLLRPEALLAARERRDRGELSPPAFKRVEDRAVDEVVAVQEAAGLPVVTDGEQRRLSFQSQLLEAVEGFGEWDLDAFLWGDWHSEEHGDHRVERPPLAVTAALRRRRWVAVEEFVYLRARTRAVPKVTLPSPSLFASFWDRERSRAAYPTLEAFLGDVAEVLRAEVDELARLGCTYVQLDAPHYPLLVEQRYRDFYASRGWPADRWLGLGTELDNHVLADRPGVVTGFHLCKGNQASRWLVAGGYEHIAGQLFGKVRVDRLLLEYDDERSGDFAPLAAIPEGTVAVLGLVTTKSPRRRILRSLKVTWAGYSFRHSMKLCTPSKHFP
jgi:5-methyltetrahydropteroyltriglutamate--homocysteine methyltransferase